MKRKSFMLGMLVLLLTFSFLIIGCGDPNGGNGDGNVCECSNPCVIPACLCPDCPGGLPPAGDGDVCECSNPCVIPACSCTDCPGGLPPPPTGDGSISDFTGAMWNNLIVYEFGNDGLVPYSGENISFTHVFNMGSYSEDFIDSIKAFSDVSNSPGNWGANVISDKLSIKLGNPDKAVAFEPFAEGITATPGLELKIIAGFTDINNEYILQWRGISEETEDSVCIFIYANKAGTVTGSAENGFDDGIDLIVNLDLKQGWNIAILEFKDEDPPSVHKYSGVPSDDFSWILLKDGNDSSPYAGEWQSSDENATWLAKFIIEGSTTLIGILQFGNSETLIWDNVLKGTFIIDETTTPFTATFTCTHVWIDEAWSENLEGVFDEESLLGEENPIVGTITGSSVGSVLFEFYIKQ